jgi:catechol 2,3-dioxygenase-like lactoylglutathione lyase family enzyme
MRIAVDNQAGVPFGYYFGCGHSTFLEFFDQTLASQFWGGKVEALTAGTRYKHFCLEVTGLDEFCQGLKNKGVPVTDISFGMDNSRQAWVTDPDGNAIELMEYGPTSLQLTGQPL